MQHSVLLIVDIRDEAIPVRPHRRPPIRYLILYAPYLSRCGCDRISASDMTLIPLICPFHADGMPSFNFRLCDSIVITIIYQTHAGHDHNLWPVYSSNACAIGLMPPLPVREIAPSANSTVEPISSSRKCPVYPEIECCRNRGVKTSN